MAKTGVTYEQVAELLEQAPYRSTRDIREVLKTGSLGTLTAHRRRWMEERNKKFQVQENWDQQAIELITAVSKQVAAQRKNFEAQAETQKTDLDAALAENTELERRLESREDQVRGLERIIEEQRVQLAKAQLRLEEFPLRIQVLEQEIRRLQAKEIELAVTQDRLATALQRVTELEERLAGKPAK